MAQIAKNWCLQCGRPGFEEEPSYLEKVWQATSIPVENLWTEELKWLQSKELTTEQWSAHGRPAKGEGLGWDCELEQERQNSAYPWKNMTIRKF